MVPGLTTCLECGGKVSQAARSCPHCASERPHGVVCLICQETLPEGRALREVPSKQPAPGVITTPKRLGYAPHGYPGVGYHRECVVNLLVIPSALRCEDCGVSVGSWLPFESLLQRVSNTWHADYSNFAWHDFACANCGRPAPLGRTECCSKCKLPIFASLHVPVSKTYEDDEGSSTYWYHEQCAPPPVVVCTCGYGLRNYLGSCPRCARRLDYETCAICGRAVLSGGEDTVVRRSGALFNRRNEYCHRACIT